MIEDVSCIRFKSQREVQHKDHIEFIAGRGCYSQIGRSGYGRQEIYLRRECAQVGTHLILHEVSINLRPSLISSPMVESHLHGLRNVQSTDYFLILDHAHSWVLSRAPTT